MAMARRSERDPDTVVTALAVVIVAVLVAVVLALPDLPRYRRLRRM